MRVHKANRLALISTSASALIVASALLIGAVGTVTAGNTRDIYFGSPPPNLANCNPTTTTYCPLNTRISPPASTTTPHANLDVVVANLGGQTVNHLAAYGGTAADSLLKNPTPTPPPSPSLDPNLSIFAVYGDGFTCDFTSTSFTCPIGTLAAHTSATFRVVLNAPATLGSYPVWFVAALNESSTTGTNQDEFYAVGAVTVATATCGETSNYFLPAQPNLVPPVPAEPVNLPAPAGCTQPTSISGPAFPTRGAFASVGTTSTNANYCPTGFTCFGLLSVANVNAGVGGPVIWTITWSSKPKGVIHFLDGYDPVTNPTAYESLAFKNTTKCPANPGTALCWFSLTTSGGLTTAVFQTATNGGSKGY